MDAEHVGADIGRNAERPLVFILDDDDDDDDTSAAHVADTLRRWQEAADIAEAD